MLDRRTLSAVAEGAMTIRPGNLQLRNEMRSTNIVIFNPRRTRQSRYNAGGKKNRLVECILAQAVSGIVPPPFKADLDYNAITEYGNIVRHSTQAGPY